MHLTTVLYKDGRIISGFIWLWQPEEGYFTLTDSSGGDPIKILFEDCDMVSTNQCRTSKDTIKDRDELQRARNELGK